MTKIASKLTFSNIKKKYTCYLFFYDNSQIKKSLPWFIASQYENAHDLVCALTFNELMMNAAINGIDFNDINFNKVCKVPEVLEFLKKNKITHLEIVEDGNKELLVQYDD